MDEREEGFVSRAPFVSALGEQKVAPLVLRGLLGAVFGLILLAVASRGIGFDAVGTGLRNADGVWVGLALAAVLVTTAVKVGRWRCLFSETRRPGLLPLGRALLVGQMVNALLPARLGDLARAHLGGRGGAVSRATALGTIAAEKAFDVLFLLICAGLTALLASLPAWLNASLAAMTALGGMVFLLAVVLPEQRILGWIERWRRSGPAVGARLLPVDAVDWLGAAFERGLSGLGGLRRPGKALVICAWSVVIWALAVGTNYVLFQAFDLELSVGAALSLLTLLQVGMAPPSSPGRLGVFHALTVVSLQTFDVDGATGLAYATVLHAIVYAPQILLGVLALGLGSRTGMGRE